MAEVIKAMALPGPQWDLGKRAMPKVNFDDVNKPTLTLEEMGKIIAIVRQGKLEEPEAAFVLLAVVYGLRQGELQAVRQEHIKYQEGTIWFETEKGGERRWQRLAPELVPYLQQYQFQWEYSDSRMNSMFKRIIRAAQVEDRYGMAWHSARRGIGTLLTEQFGELKAHIFLRWNMASSQEMALHYFGKRIEIDDEILAGHPVVAMLKAK